MHIKLNNFTIKSYLIPPECQNVDLILTRYIAQHLAINQDDILAYEILNKSIDSRRGNPALVYTLAVELKENEQTESLNYEPCSKDFLTKHIAPEFVVHDRSAGLKNPIIVGSGPAGLFAGLVLAKAGCKPIILERGYDVDKRAADIKAFETTRQLNLDSNYLVGEGGAGTFSDGKLYTRTRDPRTRQILSIMVAAGAPKEIMYLKRPHIGSDVLPKMVANIRKQIEQYGGSFLFGNRVNSLVVKDKVCQGVILDDKETISAPAVLLAHGLSGRTLTDTLINLGIDFALKGFQIGCRIEHPQAFIDENQYRVSRRPAWLGAAEYHLVNRYNAKNEIAGVSSFCMCPGGEIVASTAANGQLSTNGMSCYARSGKFANSCLIVNQPPDLFDSYRQAYSFLKTLEEKAFSLGGSDFSAPAQDANGFLQGKAKLLNNETSYKFGLVPARLDLLLPPRTRDALKAALLRFDHKFNGFLKYGKLVGIETHVSSPVRFSRDPESLESSLTNLYIAGEGAGCAGGIISAAADGMKVAEQILLKQF